MLTDIATYYKIHQWLRDTYGKADHCESCGKSGRGTGRKPTKYGWAKRVGKVHDFKKRNYIQLCAACHYVMDESGKSKDIDVCTGISRTRKPRKKRTYEEEIAISIRETAPYTKKTFSKSKFL